MRKGNYQCKRYFFYVPVALGDRMDRSVDYVLRLFGPFVVLVPQGMEFPLSTLEKAQNFDQQNRGTAIRPSSPSSLKCSKAELDCE